MFMRQDPRRLKIQQLQLDARMSRIQPEISALATPGGGWIKATRESLGMSATQLGRLMGISKQAVANLEKSEVRGALSLGSLERAARALGCRVSYAIVPETSLGAIVDQRAKLVARRKLARVGHSMALEAQGSPRDLEELQVTELANELKTKLGRELWDEP
jgi:predicted DNA-binding mobile mystery protein A